MFPNIQKPTLPPMPKLPDVKRQVDAAKDVMVRLDPMKRLAAEVSDKIDKVKRMGDVVTCPRIETESPGVSIFKKVAKWLRGFTIEGKTGVDMRQPKTALSIEIGRHGVDFAVLSPAAPIGPNVHEELRIRHDGTEVARYSQDSSQSLGQQGFGAHATQDPTTGEMAVGVEFRGVLSMDVYGDTISTENVAVEVAFARNPDLR